MSATESLTKYWLGTAFRMRKGKLVQFTVPFESFAPACAFWALQYFMFDYHKCFDHSVIPNPDYNEDLPNLS